MSHKDYIKEQFKPVRLLFFHRIKGYVGVCPFHKEKTGSCNYNEDKDAFYCFGCGAKGSGKELAEELRKMEE